MGNKKGEKEDKNSKGMHLSVFGTFHSVTLNPSFLQPRPVLPHPQLLPPPLSLVSSASSTQPQTSRLWAHPGREGKSASATRDEGGGRWSAVSPLDSRRAYTLISSDCLCFPLTSGHVMSSSSANLHNKRLPCKFFFNPPHLLQTALSYFNSLCLRISQELIVLF